MVEAILEISRRAAYLVQQIGEHPIDPKNHSQWLAMASGAPATDFSSSIRSPIADAKPAPA
jgi:hypothetical protein